MIKAVYFFKRKLGLSLEKFESHWRQVHAPIIKDLPGVRRYVQTQTLPAAYRKREPVYDGVAELWYDDLGAMRASANSPAGKAAMEDNVNFTDMSTFDFLITVERVQKDGAPAPSMVKLVEFIRRKSGLTVEAFQQHWNVNHGPLGAALREVRRYVQCHPLPGAYEQGRQPRYDGIAEVWFDSFEAMQRSESDPAYPIVRADEPNFLESTTFPLIICTEREIF